MTRTVVEAWTVPEPPLIVTVNGVAVDVLEVLVDDPPPQELTSRTVPINNPSASMRRARFRFIPPINANPITAKLSM